MVFLQAMAHVANARGARRSRAGTAQVDPSSACCTGAGFRALAAASRAAAPPPRALSGRRPAPSRDARTLPSTYSDIHP